MTDQELLIAKLQQENTTLRRAVSHSVTLIRSMMSHASQQIQSLFNISESAMHLSKLAVSIRQPADEERSQIVVNPVWNQLATDTATRVYASKSEQETLDIIQSALWAAEAKGLMYHTPSQEGAERAKQLLIDSEALLLKHSLPDTRPDIRTYTEAKSEAKKQMYKDLFNETGPVLPNADASMDDVIG